MRPVIRKESKGVVLIISPFNYPLWLSIPPAVGLIFALSFQLGEIGSAGKRYCRWKFSPSQAFRKILSD
jgi:hypothetical protein